MSQNNGTNDDQKKKVIRLKPDVKKLSNAGRYVEKELKSHWEVAADGVGIIRIDYLEENKAATESIIKACLPILSNLLAKYSDAINYGVEMVNNLSDGIDLDIDATIEYLIDSRKQASLEANIFEDRRVTDSRNQICIYLLIDCSGSMGAGAGDRILTAKIVAYLMGEVLSRLGISFCVEGFNDIALAARKNPDIALYLSKISNTTVPQHSIRVKRWIFPRILCGKTFEESWEAAKWKIGSFQAGGCTPDAPAIWRAGKVLAERPEDKKILIVISDGEPYSHYYEVLNEIFKYGASGLYPGQMELALAKDAVREVREMGVDVICVSVDLSGGYVKEIYGEDCARVPVPYLADETLAILSEKLADVGVGKKMIRPSEIHQGKW